MGEREQMNLTTWYIFKARRQDRDGRWYQYRYYKRVNKPSYKSDIYCGVAELSDEYFIPGSETQFSEVIGLNDISLEYRTTLIDGSYQYFEHTLMDLLLRAKEGWMVYMSFEGHVVSPHPTIKIKGKRLYESDLKYRLNNEE